MDGLTAETTLDTTAPVQRTRYFGRRAGQSSPRMPPVPRMLYLPRRPLAFGVTGVLGLLAFYLGVITLAQGWEHALQQLVDDRWFVGAIAIGFGTQIGLFTYLRGLHALHALHARGAAGATAASTGTSVTAMLACCAHHLTDVLPIIGLSGGVVFLNAYKTPLLWLGLVMNIGGALYLLYQIEQQRRMACHVPARSAAHDPAHALAQTPGEPGAGGVDVPRPSGTPGGGL